MPYIGRPIGVAGHTTQKLDDPASINSNAFVMKVATVAISPDAASLQIYVDGVRQEAGVAYTVSGSTISFTGGFTSSNDFQGYVMGDAMYIQTNSVDSDHYVDGSIDNAHLADDAVGVAELSATGTASSSTFLRGDNAWAAPTAPAITAIASASANQVLTDDGDATVTSEANLLFDGSTLEVGASAGSGVDAKLYTAGTAAHVGLHWDADLATEGTLIGGADDHGVDLKFYGEAAGAFVHWDFDEDRLEIRGASADASTSTGTLKLSTALTDINDGDVLGRIDFGAPLEAGGTDAILNGASIHAEADDTFAAANNETELVFSTASSDAELGSATSGALFERMRITSAGMVGIGTNSPVYRFQVSEASDIIGVFENTSSSGPYGLSVNFTAANPNDDTSFFFRGTDLAGAECYIYSDGSYSQVSDKRRKKNIVDTDEALEKVNQLSVKNYVRKNDKSEKLHIGLIAQDVQEIYPHLITEADDDMKSLTMYKIGLIPILIKAVQELSAKNEELSERLEALES